MTTAVEATDRVLVDTATAVVASVTKTATSGLQALESGIGHEDVSAADDDASRLLDRVEGSVEEVVGEVVGGVENVVVTRHPDLIAEGALAAAIGVASLVQPELIADEVPILGKIAADSAKTTVTQVASDEGEKIIKAVSRDLSEGAKAEAEKDKLQAAEKSEKLAHEVPVAESVKKPKEPEKSRSENGGDQSISIEVQTPTAQHENGSKDVKSQEDAVRVELKMTGANGEITAVSEPVAGEPKIEELKATTAMPETKQVVGLAVVKVNTPAPVATPEVTEESSKGSQASVPASTEPLLPTVGAQLITAENTSKPTTPGTPGCKEASTPIPPVMNDAPVPFSHEPSASAPVNQAELSLAIEEPRLEVDQSVPNVRSREKGPIENLRAAPGITNTSSNKPLGLRPEIASVPQSPEEVQDAQVHTVEDLLRRPNSEGENLPAKAAESQAGPMAAVTKGLLTLREEHLHSPRGSTEPDDGVSIQSSPIVRAATVEPEPLSEQVSQADSTPSIPDGAMDNSQADSSPKPLPDAVSRAKHLAISALERPSPGESSAVPVSAASVSNTSKSISAIERIEEPGPPMVTISQASLDRLHSKIDALQDAVHALSKNLATRLPPPGPDAPQQVLVGVARAATSNSGLETSAPQEQEASALPAPPTAEDSAAKPTTETPAGAAPRTPSTRAGHAKRKSVILTIGSYLWPFGGAAPPAGGARVGPVEAGAAIQATDVSRNGGAPGPDLKGDGRKGALDEVEAPAAAAAAAAVSASA
ncbi:hypothetical protein JHW43_000174 [Diplocarpon mali]|nr:hypothetical protein JHW43_000174 [Diplocarpon mali]